jgi:putative peptidoglycan lipid II flippase
MPDNQTVTAIVKAEKPGKLVATIRKYTTGTDRRIFSAAAAIAVMTLLVKLIATVKELVVAWQFGTNDTLDAFLIGWVVPAFAISVIAHSLNGALIPTYIRVREAHGQASAQKLLSSVMLASILFFIFAIVSMVGSADWYLTKLAPDFPERKIQLAKQLLTSSSLTVLLSGIATIWGAVLNAGEKFALAAVLPLFAPAATIVLLLVFPQLEATNLVTGLLIGGAIELICLGFALQRQGVNIIPRWHGSTPEFRQVMGQFAPMIVGQVMMSSVEIVDRAMASTHGSGGVAALMYGYRLVSLPINLLVTAVGTAVIPYFSRAVATEDWREIRKMMNRYLVVIFMGTLPICAFFYFFSIPITQILFERGSFTRADTLLVGEIQALYALQIPFFLAAILVVRVVSALKLGKMMSIGCAINLVVNCVLNYVFMQWMGLPGIALSTACVYLVSWLFLLGCAYIELDKAILADKFAPRYRIRHPYVDDSPTGFF